MPSYTQPNGPLAPFSVVIEHWCVRLLLTRSDVDPNTVRNAVGNDPDLTPLCEAAYKGHDAVPTSAVGEKRPQAEYLARDRYSPTKCSSEIAA